MGKRPSYEEAILIAVRTVYRTDWWPGVEDQGMTAEKNEQVVDLLDELLGIEVTDPHRAAKRAMVKLRQTPL